MPVTAEVAEALSLLQVQEVMMQGTWGPELLELPNCQVQLDSGIMIWNGPRVRMGVCEGQPASISPHITSGRADYFGPLGVPLLFIALH